MIAFLNHLSATQSNQMLSFTCLLFEVDQLSRLGLTGKALGTAKRAIQMKMPQELRKIAQFKHDRVQDEIRMLKEATVFMKKAVRKGLYEYEELRPPSTCSANSTVASSCSPKPKPGSWPPKRSHPNP